VEHLISLGHTRVAVIGGPTDVLCSRARVDGYRAAMGAAGLPVPNGYVRYGDFMSVTGYQETMALLDLPEPPTAIFVCSDQMALGAYEALYERGMRVPDDMSIVGFDDLDEARWAIPPLTTVRQPLTEMAGVATRMLVQPDRGGRTRERPGRALHSARAPRQYPRPLLTTSSAPGLHGDHCGAVGRAITRRSWLLGSRRRRGCPNIHDVRVRRRSWGR
jgi:DNA-binding LacI/PurR family transcriptional regulator